VTEAAPVRVPLATYRLQLGRHLSFNDAAGLAPYLATLGISDYYTSPFFATASEPSHGYDVADHNRLDAGLGAEAGFARLAEALRAHGLGLLMDVVPNHMGIARGCNAWWQDVLENGPASSYAHFFDIDWAPVKPELSDKVLLPILGDHYGAVLERAELRLELSGGTFSVHYHETPLPVTPRSYARILGHRIGELEAALGPEHPGLFELKRLIAWFVTLPPPSERELERLTDGRRGKAAGVERLAVLLGASPEIRAFVEDNVRRFNGTPGDPASFDLLDALLDEQPYRIAFWRVAGEEINYRRFFDINDLAAIRVEDPEVFAATHRLVFRLVGEGIVTGLRVDHPDGLYAPAEYFRRLQRGCAEALGRPEDAPGPAFHVVAEKVLAPGEPLPATWAIAGTTGYEFLNLLNGIFVDRSQARAMETLYARLIKERPSFADIVYDAKLLLMRTSMASELNMLGHRLNRISEKHRSSRDFTLLSLTRALREIIATFPVYRTYVGDAESDPPSAGGPPADPTGAPTPPATDRDREYIARAVGQAKRRTPAVSGAIYDWIQDILLLRHPPWAGPADRRARLELALRFQQMTAPVTAKGFEDTVLYRFNRLASLNEVGGDPSRFGTPLTEFHAAMAERQRVRPHGLSATSTHDTKRGEDVRARINVLSEIPADWRQRVATWQRLNRRHRTAVDGRLTPGANTEYLIYQTLVGAWPISPDRLRAYLLKAIREAKRHTSWVNPNARYEEAVLGFAEAILDPGRSARFLQDFTAFQQRVARFGLLNALAQVLVKIAAPGVPDFYQGTELWDLSLVDPDNRRPVDFALRRRLLDELVAEIKTTNDLAGLARDLLKNAEDGRIKLFVIRQGLACRRAHADLFRQGAYQALEVEGPLGEHVCAFARLGHTGAVVTVVPRLLARRGVEEAPLGPEYWGQASRLRLPPPVGRRFVNALTGEQLVAEEDALALGQVFSSFPLALLVAEA
jgi:(1->4)-alpha-D-glucan 1-alpha-D-glucosylmutase